MTEEKPLHVQVAEALGCVAKMWEFAPGSYWATVTDPAEVKRRDTDFWMCSCPNFEHGTMDDDGRPDAYIPRYDTDWAATGPLLSKYSIGIDPPSDRDDPTWARRPSEKDPALSAWTAWYCSKATGWEVWSAEGGGALVAACNLILALSAAGRLPRP